MIDSTEKKFRLTGVSPILGTYPANEQFYTNYIASKCESGEPDEGKPTFAEAEEKGLTVFPTDTNGCPVILAYQMKGYFKETLASLQAVTGIKQAKSKADQFLFVYPDQIHIRRDGEIVADIDDRLERPLRTTYMGSQMVSLKSSERIYDPWEITIQVELIPNRATTQSRALTWEALEDALDYGLRKGVLQWRNGGYGRFRWEEVKQ